MTEPKQPPVDDARRFPVNYAAEELDFIQASWGLTDRQMEVLTHLFAWKIPKQIAPIMGIATKTVYRLIDEARKRARICDGADGIKEEAAKWIARKRADPQLHRDVWWDEHERPEDWEEN